MKHDVRRSAARSTSAATRGEQILAEMLALDPAPRDWREVLRAFRRTSAGTGAAQPIQHQEDPGGGGPASGEGQPSDPAAIDSARGSS